LIETRLEVGNGIGDGGTTFEKEDIQNIPFFRYIPNNPSC